MTIKDITFVPADVTIKVGGTVTWTNRDSTTHTATSGTVSDVGIPNADKVFEGTLDAAGKTFSHTFEKAGVFKYFCARHPDSMHGTITAS